MHTKHIPSLCRVSVVCLHKYDNESTLTVYICIIKYFQQVMTHEWSHPESHLIDSVDITATFCSGAAFSEAGGAGAGGASTMAAFLDAPGWRTH